jgi:UDP-glucose 4-epimerase
MTIKTLTIGGAGYIGSHLIPELIKSGRNITDLSTKPNHNYQDKPNFKRILGDYSNIDLLNKILNDFDEVILLAYSSNILAANNYAEILEKNVIPAVNVFNICLKKNIKVIYFSSGGSVYGKQNKLPIQENFDTNPISFYGLSKLTLEKFLIYLSQNEKLNYLIIRPSNVYGYDKLYPTCNSKVGFIHSSFNAIKEGKPISIFGESGMIRDYIHISDLVNGTLSILSNKINNEIFNIGSSVGSSNIDIFKDIKDIVEKYNFDATKIHLPERRVDDYKNILNCEKLFKFTNWKAKINLKLGLQMTFETIFNKN